MSEIREAFASGLKQARKIKKITQHQLAEAAALSVDTVSRLERGDALPSFDSIEALAMALGISPLQFFSQRTSSDVVRTSERARSLADINRILANANDDEVEKYARLLKAMASP